MTFVLVRSSFFWHPLCQGTGFLKSILLRNVYNWSPWKYFISSYSLRQIRNRFVFIIFWWQSCLKSLLGVHEHLWKQPNLLKCLLFHRSRNTKGPFNDSVAAKSKTHAPTFTMFLVRTYLLKICKNKLSHCIDKVRAQNVLTQASLFEMKIVFPCCTHADIL